MPINSFDHLTFQKPKGAWGVTPEAKATKQLTEAADQARATALKATEPDQAVISHNTNQRVPHMNALLQQVKSLHTALNEFSSFKPWQGYKFTESSTDGSVQVNTTGITDQSMLGDLTIRVNQLAKQDAIVSGVHTSNTTALNLSGDININGTVMTLEATDTLEDVATKINSSTSIKARVIKQDDNEYVLSLQHPSFATPIDGTASAAGLWDTSGLKFLATPTDKETLRANLTVDGVEVKRDTNTITDIRNGLEVKLLRQSSQDVVGSVERNVSWINSKIIGIVNAYNACITTIKTEMSLKEKGGFSEDAALGGLATMGELRSEIKLPVFSSGGSIKGWGDLGYQLDSSGKLVERNYGDLVAKDKKDLVDNLTTKKPTDFTNEELKSFFATSASSSSEQFSATMPTTYLHKDQALLQRLHKVPITVEITHNSDDTYTSTMSAPGFSTLTQDFDPAQPKIIGSGDYNGIVLTHDGTEIASDSSVSSTVTINMGWSDYFYRVTNKVVNSQVNTTEGASAVKIPSLFDRMQTEIQEETNRAQARVDKVTASAEAKHKKTMAGAAGLAMREVEAEATYKLVRNALFPKRNE